MRWPWVLLLTALALSATGGVWADEDAGVEDAEEPVVEDRAFLIARKYLKADQFMVNKQPATVVIELHNAGDRRVACPCGRPAALGLGAVGGEISTQRTGSRMGEALYVASYQQTRWCVCVQTLLQICALVSARDSVRLCWLCAAGRGRADQLSYSSAYALSLCSGWPDARPFLAAGSSADVSCVATLQRRVQRKGQGRVLGRAILHRRRERPQDRL